jgi:hypothetical protein
MIISHAHRFIFIKTYKTAGTSIEVFLSKHCGDDDVLTPIRPPVETHRPRNHRGVVNPFASPRQAGDLRSNLEDLIRLRKYYNHIPAYKVRQRAPARVWSQYLKFCVERNPWDKTVSHYYMRRDIEAGRGTELTLEEYFRRGRFRLNYPLYTEPGARKCIVDRVLRYERLDADLAELMRELGVPFDGTLGVKAKGAHRRDRRSYRDVLEPRHAEIVARVFADEIALHGYTW